MPMLLTASRVIEWDSKRVERTRAKEFKRAVLDISEAYYETQKDRKAITGDSAPQVTARRKRKEKDQKRIDKRVNALKLLPMYVASNAAWVFATTAHGPRVTYLRVIPLPIRSFI
jgi:hypothetical protein